MVHAVIVERHEPRGHKTCPDSKTESRSQLFTPPHRDKMSEPHSPYMELSSSLPQKRQRNMVWLRETSILLLSIEFLENTTDIVRPWRLEAFWNRLSHQPLVLLVTPPPSSLTLDELEQCVSNTNRSKATIMLGNSWWRFSYCTSAHLSSFGPPFSRTTLKTVGTNHFTVDFNAWNYGMTASQFSTFVPYLCPPFGRSTTITEKDAFRNL